MSFGEQTLDQIVQFLNKLQGLPAIALVFVGCLAFGYLLRFVKSFPNSAIPVAVILMGAVIYPLIADDQNSISLRVWIVRNCMIGLGVGLISWLAHFFVFSKIEDWLASKFPGLNDTAMFTKADVDKPVDNPVPTPQPPKS